MRKPDNAEEMELLGELVEKYAAFFGLPEDHFPDVEIKDNLGSKWFARTIWNPKRPETSTIQIQESVVGDATTLERVVAHEMIHHVNFMRMTDEEKTLLKYMRGSLSDGHGKKFHELAAKVNAEMGEDFVTERSDEDFEVTPNEKAFYVLIEPAHMGRVLGWSWAVKLSNQAKEEIARRTRDLTDIVLVQTTDGRFTKGVKIKRFGGCSVPRAGSEDAQVLQELYDQATGDR